MQDDALTIKNQAVARIMSPKDITELEQIRIDYLGNNGILTKLIKNLKDIPAQDRKQKGIVVNEAKKLIDELLENQKRNIKESVRKWFDPTIPGEKPEIGHIHLISKTIDEISRIFSNIGFKRASYPEVEWDYFAFTALNTPESHPARYEWETFFIDTPDSKKYGKMVLTPHTSSGQVREMLRTKNPPIRMINIGKCYRRQSDVSHVPMFHQFEGLVIDKDITISNLKGTLDYFAKSFYGE
jgi:phenylalanyl-tRNA synthetase alpha chain